DAILEAGDVEVDEEAERQPGGPHVADELSQVDVRHAFYRFQFYNDAALDDQIEPLLGEEYGLVRHAQHVLALKPHAAGPKLVNERVLVETLKKAGAKR